jgi:hypothetical protein
MRKLSLCALILIFSCGPDSGGTVLGGNGGGSDNNNTGGGGGGSAATGGGNGDQGGNGLPCDVAQALATNCRGCHANPTTNAAPFPLMTRDDLTKESPTYAGQTIGQRCVARMKDTQIPMPPAYFGPPASQADQDAIANWVSAGMPFATCSSGTGGGSAGTGGGSATGGGTGTAGGSATGGGTGTGGGSHTGGGSATGGGTGTGGGSGIDYSVCQNSALQCIDADGAGDYACIDPNSTSGFPSGAPTCQTDADCPFNYTCWSSGTTSDCLQNCGSSATGGGAGGGGSTGGGSGTGGGSATGGGGGTSCGTDTWSNYASSFFSTNCMTTCHQHTGEFTQSDVQTYTSSIRSRISSGSMPADQVLSSAVKARIIAYLNCGAP